MTYKPRTIIYTFCTFSVSLQASPVKFYRRYDGVNSFSSFMFSFPDFSSFAIIHHYIDTMKRNQNDNEGVSAGEFQQSLLGVTPYHDLYNKTFET